MRKYGLLRAVTNLSLEKTLWLKGQIVSLCKNPLDLAEKVTISSRLRLKYSCHSFNLFLNPQRVQLRILRRTIDDAVSGRGPSRGKVGNFQEAVKVGS